MDNSNVNDTEKWLPQAEKVAINATNTTQAITETSPCAEQTADKRYMQRCLQLAKCGLLGAKPNPMVGAVIVYRGRIIGEGYHAHYGEAHAEVNAFASVKPQDEALLPQATLYVSLEPCAHHGKTPPCADLIITKGVPRVVVGCVDPYAKVQGRGIEKLRQAGIEVVVGVLEKACLALNRPFMVYQRHHRPYVILKWAQISSRLWPSLRHSPRCFRISLGPNAMPSWWVKPPTNANILNSTRAIGGVKTRADWCCIGISPSTNCSLSCIKNRCKRSLLRAVPRCIGRLSRPIVATRYTAKRLLSLLTMARRPSTSHHILCFPNKKSTTDTC